MSHNRISLAALLAEAPLYAIMDTVFERERSPLKILESLLRAGVRVIQYRQKGKFTGVDFERCRVLATRCRESGAAFVLNDRSDVAALCGAAGVHLGQDDLAPEKARRFLGDGFVIGYSTHDLEQARQAADSAADYIAIGPIFATSSKQNPDPVVGLEMISRVRTLTSKPVVAIGGITLENAAQVLSAGANGVAVIRDLLSANDIEGRAMQFLNALRSTAAEARSPKN